jgi:hypothetical protein
VVAPGARLRRNESFAGDSIETSVASFAADSATYALAGAGWQSLIGRPGVTYAPGDVALSGTLSGILLVGGRLRITGQLVATGVVIARGGIESAGGSVTISGALLSVADGTSDAPSVDLSDARVRYSPCTVVRAFNTANAPRPVRARSWAELF